MIWQDLVITIANILFSYALIPQVYHGFKNKRTSITYQASFITFIGMFAMATAFFTLGLYFSFYMSLISGTLWLILFIQKLIYK